jgi:hypothetical protein
VSLIAVSGSKNVTKPFAVTICWCMLVSLMSARDVIEDSDSEAVTFDTCKKMGSPHRVTDLTRFTGFYLARILAPAIARLTRRGLERKNYRQEWQYFQACH